MNIISDFSDIARRMNRKPEKVAAIDNSAAAAVKTLQSLGYTYTDGAEMWKPPLGSPSQSRADAYDKMKAMIRSGYGAAGVGAWKAK